MPHVKMVVKAKFRDAMQEAGFFDQISSEDWQLDWNVNSQAVGSSQASLKYLAPSVFKVALSNNRIIKVENNTVFFQYTKPHSRRPRTMALDAIEFIRRFLQHVLPTGFMKIRYYGFLNPNCSVPFEGPFSSNISGSMTPSQTRVTGPVITAVKAGERRMVRFPPGM